MSFGGSFWSILNFAHQSSQIDELLSRPDTTVDQLLEDENILSEFKSLNPRLLEYHTDDKIKQLLSYLIEEPPEDADHNRGHKFPFVACEVLTADIQTFLSAFFGKNPNNRKSKEQNNQDSSEDFDEYQNNPAENKEEENAEKKEEQEPEQPEKEAEKEPEEATEKETKPESAETEEPKAETGETGEVEENKENASKEEEEGEKEEPREKRMSITVRSPAKDTESEKSEEENNQGTPELADYFFSFLSHDTLNVTLVGYFARFLNHIILRRGIETANFVWSNPHIVDHFIKHLEHSNLAECLAKLFCMEGLPNNMTNDFLDIRLEKLNKMIEAYSEEISKLNSEILANTSYIICELISRRATVLRGAEITNFIFSKEFLEVLFGNLYRHKTLTTSLATVLNALLLAVLQKKTVAGEESPAEGEEETDNLKSPTEGVNINEKLFIEYVAGSIGEMVEFLEGENPSEIKTTYGNTHKPFGLGKLKILESILYMVKLNVHKVSFELGLKKIFQALMGLMLAFEWNNMLHNQIEKIFVSTLESDSHVLKQKLFNQADLIGFLGRATQETIYKMPNPQHRKMRKGYLGHITRIGKVLEKLAETDKDIKSHLEGDKWAEFNDNYLKPSIKTDNHDLAGFAKKPSDDFIDDNIHIGNNLDDALGGKFEGFYGFDALKPSEEGDANVFSDFKGFESWGEPNNDQTENTGMTSSWPSGFDTQGFGFTVGESAQQTAEDNQENNYLELNKEVKIIDMEGQKEVILTEEFYENQYWAKPIRSDIDDILKEFEQI